MDKGLAFAVVGCLLLSACDGDDQPDATEGVTSRSSALIGLSVAPIFGAHMVLQRNATVPVFGAADPGSTVEVQSAPKHVRYGFSGAGNLINHVSVPTEGGTKTVTSLPASLFQIDFP